MKKLNILKVLVFIGLMVPSMPVHAFLGLGAISKWAVKATVKKAWSYNIVRQAVSVSSGAVFGLASSAICPALSKKDLRLNKVLYSTLGGGLGHVAYRLFLHKPTLAKNVEKIKKITKELKVEVGQLTALVEESKLEIKKNGEQSKKASFLILENQSGIMNVVKQIAMNQSKGLSERSVFQASQFKVCKKYDDMNDNQKKRFNKLADNI